MLPETKKNPWLDRPLTATLPGLTIEVLLIVVILLTAVCSRFYDLGARVMSHDEVNHVVPSYNYYQGQVYRYDPVTHGPLQFHLIALSYFLLGDSDFTSRLPAALFSIATIAIVLFAFRRYLGRSGSIIAGFLFLISPYMLFYGRYARNEAFIVVWALLLIYAVLRYVETGKTRFLYLFTVVTALHFIDKATSFIFAAEMLLFLGLYFIERISRRKWNEPAQLRNFIILLMLTIVMAVLGVGLTLLAKPQAGGAAATAATQSMLVGMPAGAIAGLFLAILLAVVSAAGAIYFMVKGLGWTAIRGERSFDLLMLQITLVLPLLVALLVKIAGFDPLDYSSAGIIRAVLFIIPLFIVAVLLGLWWFKLTWLHFAAIFWVIFTVFYTSFFNNPAGFAMGLVGALGYWMAQQSVNRGSQPWYYYLVSQLPMYEYLSVLGTVLAAYLGFRHRLWHARSGEPYQHIEETADGATDAGQGSSSDDNVLSMEEQGLEASSVEPAAETPVVEKPFQTAGQLVLRPVPVLVLLLFWSVSSLVAFSFAGEKMPWLTIHIAAPMLLASGWALGYLVDTTHWERLRDSKVWLVILLVVVFLASLSGLVGTALGQTPPFQGKELAQLEATSLFVISLVVALATGYGLMRLLLRWHAQDLRHVFTLVFFAILAVLTGRAAFRAAYINYDTAKEFLVYAHAARGPKDVLAQIEELSYRTSMGKDMVIAYDNDMLYPFWFYLRDYTNLKYFADKPTRDIRNAVVIVAGQDNFAKVDSIVGNDYYKFDYMRLWWPMEDYKNLNWSRIVGALTNPQLRAGIFDIWLNADYRTYATATNNNSLTLENWSPSNRMRLYIRKDVVSEMWTYGAAPAAKPIVVDPYAQGSIQLAPTQVITSDQLQSPRQVAVAPDGSLYVANSANNRVVHFSADGQMLQAWGSFADISKGAAPGGTFNQIWGIAVGPDGSVYVSDWWNHRIQKFTADGQFIKMWGHLGDGTDPTTFYGPRGLAVDAKGRVYVADTGNKYIEIYDADGNYITRFGGAGSDPGQLDEPVGVALDKQGQVYVTDTWNQRVQVFKPDATGMTYTPVLEWNIDGWNGQSVENKPYIAVDDQHVFVTDPEGYRVIEFTLKGDFVHVWGSYSADQTGFGMTSGIAIDAQGAVWVSDSANQKILKFIVP